MRFPQSDNCAVGLCVVAPCIWVTFPNVSKKRTAFTYMTDSIHRLRTLTMTPVRSFGTSTSNYPATRCNNPEDLVLQYENRYATSMSVSFVVSRRGSCMTIVRRSRLFCLAFSSSLACYSSEGKYGCIIPALFT
jgi:hypothetical protein